MSADEPLTTKRPITTVEPARATVRLHYRRYGPPPSPAGSCFRPDARQPEVPTRRGEHRCSPLVDPAPLRSHGSHLRTRPSPPHRRGGAWFAGREDRGASGTPQLRQAGSPAAPAAQRVARGRERVRLGDARAGAVGASAIRDAAGAGAVVDGRRSKRQSAPSIFTNSLGIIDARHPVGVVCTWHNT